MLLLRLSTAVLLFQVGTSLPQSEPPSIDVNEPATDKVETNLILPSCFVEDRSYDHSAITTILPHLQSPEDCQTECEKMEGCEAFTWHKNDATVLPNVCALFGPLPDPITTVPCEDQCVSGVRECECPPKEFQGQCSMNADNFLDVHHGLLNTQECRKLCQVFDNHACSHFTYYDHTSDFPSLCLLLKGDTCEVEECQGGGCQYGPRDCQFEPWQSTISPPA